MKKRCKKLNAREREKVAKNNKNQNRSRETDSAGTLFARRLICRPFYFYLRAKFG